MKGLIKKSFLLGVGAASLTRKKANKAVKMMVRKGVITASDGNKLVTGMLKEADRYRKKLEKLGEEELKRSLKAMGLKSMGEINRLKQKAMQLEKELKRKAKATALKAIQRL